uniref:Uncharacterized protein n=1 Tax=Megaselia scalaris TaxID=36166 RepID=T1GFZ0_MEGSC
MRRFRQEWPLTNFLQKFHNNEGEIPLTRTEMDKAVQRPKNNKIAGTDGIPVPAQDHHARYASPSNFTFEGLENAVKSRELYVNGNSLVSTTRKRELLWHIL